MSVKEFIEALPLKRVAPFTEEETRYFIACTARHMLFLDFKLCITGCIIHSRLREGGLSLLRQNILAKLQSMNGTDIAYVWNSIYLPQRLVPEDEIEELRTQGVAFLENPGFRPLQPFYANCCGPKNSLEWLMLFDIVLPHKPVVLTGHFHKLRDALKIVRKLSPYVPKQWSGYIVEIGRTKLMNRKNAYE